MQNLARRTTKRKDQKAEFERAWGKKVNLLIDRFFSFSHKT